MIWFYNRFDLFTTWCASCLLILAFVSLLVSISSSGETPKLHFPIHRQPRLEGLERILHPQDHAFRNATKVVLNWLVTKGLRSPDGVLKEVYLINGNFPGPTVEVRSGDTLVVDVFNQLEDEGLSIHWHGLHMRGANGMDGAVGFTQCPIPPGSNFSYSFAIDENQAGTFWYHSHWHEQTGDGIYGGLIIHQPSEIGIESDEYEYDEEILLLIGDWYHRPVKELLKEYLSFERNGAEPVPDSLLINGRGQFDCSMALNSHPVKCRDILRPLLHISKDKIHRFRIVNIGSLTGITLSLPKMRIIQLDGGARVLGELDVQSIGILYPGERMDVVQTIDSTTASLIVTLDHENFQFQNLALTPTQSFEISSVAGSIARPSYERGARQTVSHFDLSDAKGLVLAYNFFPVNAKKTFVIYSSLVIDSINGNIPMGRINHTSWKPQRKPLILLNRTEWNENQFVPWTGPGDGWVDLVVNNVDERGHPFHLHGNDFYVLSTHRGIDRRKAHSPFTSDTLLTPLNFVNPLRKDTVYIPGNGYAVLRFRVDTEGIWMFHCHLLWHQAGGMAMAFHIGGDEMGVFKANRNIEKQASRLCRQQNDGVMRGVASQSPDHLFPPRIRSQT